MLDEIEEKVFNKLIEVAKELGKIKSLNDEAKRDFFSQELKEVYKIWSKKP